MIKMGLGLGSLWLEAGVGSEADAGSFGDTIPNSGGLRGGQTPGDPRGPCRRSISVTSRFPSLFFPPPG